MNMLLTLLNPTAYIDFPNQILGWFGLLLVVVATVLSLRRVREPGQKLGPVWWAVVLGLMATVPLTTLFIGLRLPQEQSIPVPGLPMEIKSPVLMFFSAVPWVLAGGLLGPLPAAALGFLSGLLLGIFETHSLFTSLEFTLLAMLYAVAVRQRYRTPFYRFIRQPLGAALVLAVAFAPVYILTAFFAINGELAVRLDYALTQTWLVMLVRGGALMVAGFLAQILVWFRLPQWGGRGPLVPSPNESSLQVRFLSATAPLVLILVLVLTLGDWIVAGNAAQKMVRDRLSSTAQVAAESLPYFLETGQNLILNLADQELVGLPPEQVKDGLAQRLRAVPYFRQLFLLDDKGNPYSGYPKDQFEQLQVTPEEKLGIQLAVKGVVVQTYTIPPEQNEETAQVSFIAAIKDKQGVVKGVLLGRTDLNSNPFTQPAIQALSTLNELDGEGTILDENRRILYHRKPELVMKDYIGRIPDKADFFDETSPTGVRRLVYYQPVVGRPWAVVLTVPATQTQQLSLNIAIPLLVTLLIVSAIAFVMLRFGLRGVTASTRALANEATLIAQGQLDHVLPFQGEDEVGQLGRAFEQMRQSLKDRLDDLNRLLAVSQGVAANLEAEDAVKPVLKAALGSGASSARVVLVREVTLDTKYDRPIGLGDGPATNAYAYLDGQIYDLLQQQDNLSIPNTTRVRRLNILPGAAQPGAVLAVALRHESRYFGVIWIAFDQPHVFSESEVRFLTTLAGQAALAASNAALYASAEIGRQRLEAVLSSTPEPVLVTDEKLNLLLLNPAAMQVPGLIASAMPGSKIQDVLTHPDLLMLITSAQSTPREISLQNGRIYFANVSPVIAEGRQVGKVCILQDITHYKEMDTLKTDFVATVSHDLRSPLTLMRGYATMLQMVGEMNDQQKGYVNKIINGVDSMNRLVTSLLDLARIEVGVGLQIERIGVGEIVEQVVSSLQPQCTQKNINLTHDLGEKPVVLVEADRALFQQSVYNLVENAIKYTPMNGQVRVHMEARANNIVLMVQDNGIGIAPLDQPHIFGKFYRSGRREAYQQRGTGLGLAIVKSIVERHGGKVWVESQLGKGSTFFMEVPYKQVKKAS
jgi:two-component system NtrC family sensor kinase